MCDRIGMVMNGGEGDGVNFTTLGRKGVVNIRLRIFDYIIQRR